MDINQLNINQLFSQAQTIATLYAEILICIVAAGLLGLIVGLMMQRSRQRRRLARVTSKLQLSYDKLEASSRAETASLEGQIQSLAKETKTLQATNKALTESLKKNDISIQKARAEAIELNRQHTETHERLQRIVQRKDRELNEIGNRTNLEHMLPPKQRPTPDIKAAASVTRLVPEVSQSDLDNADTIAITPTLVPTDTPDTAKEPDVKETADKAKVDVSESKFSRPKTSEQDASLDDTSDLSEYGLEESTVAMDEEALALAQQAFKGQRRD